MKIVIGISDADIQTIRKVRLIAEMNCNEYERKKDTEEFSGMDAAEYEEWVYRYSLFNRMEALIDNQLALDGQVAPASSTGERLFEFSTVLEEQCLCENQCRVKDMDLMTAFVCFSGILIKRSKYWSHILMDFLGTRVLVTVPKDGKIAVYSMEGQYLTDAFIVKGQ